MLTTEAWIIGTSILQHPLSELKDVPNDSCTWLLVARDQLLDYIPIIEKLTQSQLNEQHIKDALNSEHPSFFDSTSQYEMVVFRGIVSSEFDMATPHVSITFSSLACFNFEKILLTVYDNEESIINKVQDFILKTNNRVNTMNPNELLYLILDTMIDQSLALRTSISQILTQWQHLMLEKTTRFKAWNEFMSFKNTVEQLSILSEDQEDAIENWQQYSRHIHQQQFNINLNDLNDHIERCTRHLQKLSNNLDMLIQLHYTALSHRNNEVLRVLAIISCVFLPLTLITGIFGMNFENMPVLHQPHAYYYTMGSMVGIGVGLLSIFKWRKWL